VESHGQSQDVVIGMLQNANPNAVGYGPDKIRLKIFKRPAAKSHGYPGNNNQRQTFKKYGLAGKALGLAQILADNSGKKERLKQRQALAQNDKYKNQSNLALFFLPVFGEKL
jgi:hypothetical protein